MSLPDLAPARRVRRRTLLVAPLALATLPVVAGAEAEALLRSGGVVIGIRHSLAPGTFDPPGFRLDDCRTQRNLNDEGRAQARRLGQWFRERGLVPESVRTSPWCRCVDTAELAFGNARPWTALGSPVGSSESVQADKLAELRRALAEAARRPGRFEAWVTHMFVLRDLAGVSVSVGEGLVLASREGRISVLARLAVA
ncbi:MAG: histidine phosphatase family protein [Ideonella sp.]|nr:histidine phosphatase family protein [Ideonella sp.]